MAKRKNANGALGLANAIESLPWIVRVILALLYGLYGNIIRLLRSIGKGNLLGIILAAILIIAGGLVVLWVLDFIFVLLNKKIWWID